MSVSNEQLSRWLAKWDSGISPAANYELQALMQQVETTELHRLRTELLEVNKALGLGRDNQDNALRVKTALRLRLPVEPSGYCCPNCANAGCTDCQPETRNLGPEAPGGVGVIDLAARSPEKASEPQKKCWKCDAPVYSNYCQCCGSPQDAVEDDHGSPIVDDL